MSKLRFGSPVFVVTDNKVLTGKYVSKSPSWNYVVFDDGQVKGFSDTVLFAKREDALDYLVAELNDQLGAKYGELVKIIKAKETKS